MLVFTASVINDTIFPTMALEQATVAVSGYKFHSVDNCERFRKFVEISKFLFTF